MYCIVFKKNVKKVKKETTGSIYTNYMEMSEAVSSSSGQLESNFQITVKSLFLGVILCWYLFEGFAVWNSSGRM